MTPSLLPCFKALSIHPPIALMPESSALQTLPPPSATPPAFASLSPSHLPTLHNTNIMHGPIPLGRIRPDLLHLPHDVLPLHHPPKHNMLPIQKWRRRTRNEELAPIRIRPAVRHGQQKGRVVLVREVLVREALRVPRGVDGGRARAVAVQEVAALDHEGLDDAVEFRELVALQGGGWGGAVADAELAEVFGRERGRGGVEDHFDAAEGLTCVGEGGLGVYW
jgi:hypothetical protein